jgi:hypothetical protein
LALDYEEYRLRVVMQCSPVEVYHCVRSTLSIFSVREKAKEKTNTASSVLPVSSLLGSLFSSENKQYRSFKVLVNVYSY